MHTPHITDVPQPRTAISILDTFQDSYINACYGGPQLDSYHLLVVNAAHELHREGCGHFVYMAGDYTTTVWSHPTTGATIIVEKG